MKDTDRTIIGAFAGILGGLSLILYLYLLGIFLPAAPKIILFVGALFVPTSKITTIGGQVIAHTAHLIVSALLGIIFINIFRITGRDWVITKGIIFSLAVWIILGGGVVNLLKLTTEKPDISVAMAVLTSHIVFGIVTALSALLLSNKLKL